jgi:hypothetical protein
MRGKAFLAAIIACFLFYTSCSKIDDSTELNIVISPDTIRYTIPIITSLDTGYNIASIPLRLNLDSMIKLQNKRFSAADIETIKLNSFRMNLSDIDTAYTFANFQNLSLTFEGNGETSKQLASSNFPDSKVKVLNLPITDTDNNLKTKTSGGLVNVKLKGKLRRATAKPYAIKATAAFRVTLKL